jgi:type IX secretion system PorP/SprF family membrane protein
MKYFINTFKILVFLLVGTMYSQQEANYALYRYTMNAVNPAYAGADGDMSFTANFRSQWQGVQDAPETQSLFFAMPMGERVGLGLSVINDATFIENETGVYIDFSYRLPVSENTNLFLGLKAGGSTYSLDQDNLRVLGFPSDPAVNNIDNGFKPNVGIGAYLMNDQYFVSLSSPNLLSPERVDVGTGTVTNKKPHIYLAGGYNFGLGGGDTEFRPSAILKYVDGAPVSVDITAAFKFLNKFEVGAIYRTDKAFGGVAMLDLADWMSVGYGYESSSRNEITNISDGTHEVLIRFNFGKESSSQAMDDN